MHTASALQSSFTEQVTHSCLPVSDNIDEVIWPRKIIRLHLFFYDVQREALHLTLLCIYRCSPPRLESIPPCVSGFFLVLLPKYMVVVDQCIFLIGVGPTRAVGFTHHRGATLILAVAWANSPPPSASFI